MAPIEPSQQGIGAEILRHVNEISRRLSEAASIQGRLQSDFAALHSQVTLHGKAIDGLQREQIDQRLRIEKQAGENKLFMAQMEEHAAAAENRLDRLESSINALTDAVKANEPALTKKQFDRWAIGLVIAFFASMFAREYGF